MPQFDRLVVVFGVFVALGTTPALAQPPDTDGRSGPQSASAGIVTSTEAVRLMADSREAAGLPVASSEALEPESPTQPREWAGHGLKWSNWSRMTGDWGRLRTDLEARGLSFQFGTISDVSGLAQPSSAAKILGRQLTTVELTFDLEKTVGLTGGRVRVQYQDMGGTNGAYLANAIQGFSNIDAVAFHRFGEVWFEQEVGERFHVKTGLIDANKEFAFVENGADFINPSMGYSPTIFPLPTYPDPHIGLVVHAHPTEQTYATAGVFNGGPQMGVPDFRALLWIGESGVNWKGWRGGRVGIGYWRVAGDRAGEDAALEPIVTDGHYLVVDQTLWADERDGVARSVAAFFQGGWADPRVADTSSHLGAGVVARGLVPGRPDDALGVGVTAAGSASLTGLATSNPTARREVNVDTFYRLALTKWVALKPDVQFIRHPGGDVERRPLVAATLRVEVGF